MAADNLRVGRTVVADSVNPWPLTRDESRAVGEQMGVPVVESEVVRRRPALLLSRLSSGVFDYRNLATRLAVG